MAKSIGDYLNGIPAKRWHIIALRTELSEDTILDSPALTLAICANEKHRAEAGRDDYPRFLGMGLGDLNDYLGEDLAEGEAGAEVAELGRFPGDAGSEGIPAEEGDGVPGTVAVAE